MGSLKWASIATVAKGCAVDRYGYAYAASFIAPGDYLLRKFRPSDGQEVWSQSYNAPANANDYGNDCDVDDSGYVYITGRSGNGVNDDIITIKYKQSLDPPEIPTLTWPDSGSVINGIFPTLQWQNAAYATKYHVQLKRQDGIPVVDDTTFGAASTSYMVMTPLNIGQQPFSWQVRSGDDYGTWSPWSSLWNFTVDTIPPQTVLNSLQPQPGAFNVNVFAAIQVEFSEDMDTNSLTINSYPNIPVWQVSWSDPRTMQAQHNTAPFPFSTTCSLEVWCYDRAGNTLNPDAMHPNLWTFATQSSDTFPPMIAHAVSDTATIIANSPAELVFNISDSQNPVDTALYCLGPAGGSLTQYDQPLINRGGGAYGLPIPNVPWRGVMYDIKARDAAGNWARYPSDSNAFYVKAASFPQGQLLQSKDIQNDRWQMVSAAGDAYFSMFNQIADDFGAYDKTKWRLFVWQSGGYAECGTPNSGTTSRLGQAFWLRQRISSTPIRFSYQDVRKSYGNRMSDMPAQIPLNPGWNDVGNPWQFEVDFNEILVLSDMNTVDGPYTYDGNAWVLPNDILTSTDPVMKPFAGYCFRVDDGASHMLRIPCKEFGTKGRAAFSLPKGWQASMTVSIQDGRYDKNYFGIGEGALEGVDCHDYPEPPSELTGVSGYFTIGSRAYATDIRPELGKGQSWEFTVATGREPATITVALPSEYPGNAECYLLDPMRQASFPVSDGFRYFYQPEPGETERRFKLMVGGGEYIRDAMAGAFGMPSITRMEQNRPNPFTQSTAINYQLAAAGPVSVVIYNVAGQRVRTLADRIQAAGRYSLRWDGRDDRGRKVSAGVYVCRLAAPGVTQFRKLSIVR